MCGRVKTGVMQWVIQPEPALKLTVMICARNTLSASFSSQNCVRAKCRKENDTQQPQLLVRRAGYMNAIDRVTLLL